MGAIGVYRGYASGLQHSMRLHGAFVADCLRRAFPSDKVMEEYDKPFLFRGDEARDAATPLYKIDRYLVPRRRFLGRRLDMLVVTDHSDGYVSFLSAAARKIIICHDALPKLLALGLVEGRPPSRLGRALLQVNGAALARADLVICVSECTRRDLLTHFDVRPERAIVIHNCPMVDQDLGGRGAARARPDVAKVLADSRPYVLSVGGGKFYKNLRSIPPVLRKLISLGVDARWVIVGGADFDPADEGIEGRVSFLSRLDGKDMKLLYQNAGALFFPSLYEGFGLPVVEAQMYGAPVVCSDRGAVPEVAGDSAIVVPPHDHDGAADALARVLTDPNLRQQMVAAGLLNVARFSRSSREQAYEAAFKAVMGG